MNNCNVTNRTIFCKDNLEVLQGINSNCIDLVYLDPPFNKNKKFTAPVGSSAEGASFDDIFRQEDVKKEWLLTIREDHPGLYCLLDGIRGGGGKSNNFAYLAYMAIRLIECKRVLKYQGSIYLHCDPTMSHYLKMIMDCIFKQENFKSEIIWKRYGSHNNATKKYGQVTDTILFYSENKATWNSQKISLTNEDIAKRYTQSDEHGLYTTSPLHARSLGGNYQYTWRGIKDVWKFPKHRLNELDKEGKIHWPKKGKVPRRKVYLQENTGRPLSNLWTDISIASGKERVGYPTQKPLALLERIIKASSDPGDMILDPFCGCATTCIAAEQLDRQWIGIDKSAEAYRLVMERLDKEVDKPQSDWLKGDTKVRMLTNAPKRSEQEYEGRESKYVYVVSNPKYPGEYKVGIAKDWKHRLNAYQTSEPDRGFKIEHTLLTPAFRETERHVHSVFENKHEWIRGNLHEIIKAINEFKPIKQKQQSLIE